MDSQVELATWPCELHFCHMAKKRSLLQQMGDNPKKGWVVADVQKLCNQEGLELLPPKKGSHYKVASSCLRDILTIPAHRPIKPIYIRQLVSYAIAHVTERGDQDDQSN